MQNDEPEDYSSDSGNIDGSAGDSMYPKAAYAPYAAQNLEVNELVLLPFVPLTGSLKLKFAFVAKMFYKPREKKCNLIFLASDFISK